MYLNITIDELLKKNSGTIIDIRQSSKYKIGHIKNAKNISKNELMFNTENYLNKLNTYYIYCSKGMQSKSLCSYLNKLGYKVYNLLGGYESYKK